jgi:hypothetical protein
MKENLLKVGYFAVPALVGVLMIVLFSCTKSPVVPPLPPPLCTSWEYKVLYAQPLNNPARDPEGGKGMLATSITPNGEELNKEGKDGWELASTYLETETAYFYQPPANAVDKGTYAPNIRPQRLVMVFKRLSCPK